MTREEILGIARHILTTAGGALASRGIIDSTETELIVGAIITVAGVAWSIIAKRRSPSLRQ
ncbi:MAG: hypothetical protein Unbinned338contig1000_62 [Prokaryotic dsDNA virus sp.]|nr:MAG: hypothetical protein Unbinned338contig1000_62 [Prokaryotic dsDNA virus sp.]|tara:strand:+ start:42426 stop:42608 length:183 start_codon:yes stop_codon:yes gene_type:complete